MRRHDLMTTRATAAVLFIRLGRMHLQVHFAATRAIGQRDASGAHHLAREHVARRSRVGNGAAPAPVSPDAPPRATSRLVHVRFVIRDTIIQVSKGVMYRAWSFEGRVPGPP